MSASDQPQAAVSEAELLRAEVRSLRERLQEADDTLTAIRNGDVDAVVVSGTDSVPHIYTLETADQTYRILVEEMQEGAMTLTRGGDILYCNKRLAEIVETEPARVIGGSLTRFIAAAEWSRVVGLISSEFKGELSIKSGTNRTVPAHVSFSALRGDDLGREDIFCCIVTDLTEQQRTNDQLRVAHAALVAQVAERERTEKLLRQSQKMEAIGQLTGGIAHDFNNLLMVITGGLSILDRTPAPERRQKIRDGMRQAAERGASLTKQLLAFSRQKDLVPKPIDLSQHIGGMRALLDASLGGTVTVDADFAATLWRIRADEGELGIAILNLCVNARDAMPQGGVITIAAENRPQVQEHGLAGDFVELSVTDSGEGMDAVTMARCMEPFYTTKDIGKGSGLGLAQVYGFARGSNGYVLIDSNLGQGTRVSMLLPRSTELSPVPEATPAPRETTPRKPDCRVLLVEDDLTVANLTKDMLQELGYEVIQVADASAGLKAMTEDHGVGLVMSDVMMPGGVDGLAFVQEIRRRFDALPVVLVTGFPDGVRKAAAAANVPLLAKPYDLASLEHLLDNALSRC